MTSTAHTSPPSPPPTSVTKESFATSEYSCHLTGYSCSAVSAPPHDAQGLNYPTTMSPSGGKGVEVFATHALHQCAQSRLDTAHCSVPCAITGEDPYCAGDTTNVASSPAGVPLLCDSGAAKRLCRNTNRTRDTGTDVSPGPSRECDSGCSTLALGGSCAPCRLLCRTPCAGVVDSVCTRTGMRTHESVVTCTNDTASSPKRSGSPTKSHLPMTSRRRTPTSDSYDQRSGHKDILTAGNTNPSLPTPVAVLTSGDVHRTGAKCVPASGSQDPRLPGTEYHARGVWRTKPGRGDPTISMSCSDKIARWLVTGCQGALVMHFLRQPIRLSSVIVLHGDGDPIPLPALQRAFVSRTVDIVSDLAQQPEWGRCKPVVVATTSAAAFAARHANMAGPADDRHGDKRLPCGSCKLISDVQCVYVAISVVT